MSESIYSADPFLRKAVALIETHLEEESFGVAELANELHMNRSTLLRRIKKSAGVSAAVFIRKVRLQRAKELLQLPSLTISEIAYQVGFSSSSYFAKCFREEYGYPPGEEGKQQSLPIPKEAAIAQESSPTAFQQWRLWVLLAGLVLVGATAFFLYRSSTAPPDTPPKTIAVLPFQNDSQDSSNVYLINGLMVALIDNLHQIEDVQVTSRTTVERYRGHAHTVPELAKELDVSYFVEGSGQKNGDQILLTLRLIDAQSDTLIWSKRYQRESTDIFQLQSEVATSIAQEIEVFISPEEKARLVLPPTENLIAYDHFLRGMEEINQENRESLIKGIASLEQAIEEDPDFAHPYAFLAISYYFLDIFQAEQSHVEDINTYADKAFLLDPDLTESLIGKALYYMQTGQYELAIEFFHKVLEKDPGSGWTHNLLSTIYILHLPNTEQYLRHAIQGIPYAIAGQDSSTTSFAYLHLGNALAQNGFLAEAEPYLEKSLSYQPNNLFAGLLSIYIQFGQQTDLAATYQDMQGLLEKDTTFLSTLQEVAKIAYYLGEYAEAWEYYERFFALRDAASVTVYPGADINAAFVLDALGRPEEAEVYRERYLAYLQTEESMYRDLGFAVYYASVGDQANALAAFQEFSQKDSYQYWMIMFLDQDPILGSLASDPGFAPAVQRIQETFWEQHEEMRTFLQMEGVLGEEAI